ncbi:MAG: hypothetical protein V4475_02495 [Pseudomonadota bacterium]
MSELPAAERIDGDGPIIPAPDHDVGLEPVPGCFFIALAMLVIAMVITILFKQMP